MSERESTPARISVERIDTLSASDLDEICDAARRAIRDGGGFGWLNPPDRSVMEQYWKGIALVRERELFIARVDGVICGAAQLLHPPRSNEAQAHMCKITGHFVAPWARGLGAGHALAGTMERHARDLGFRAIRLDLRATQSAAIKLYSGLNYTRWGVNPYYAMVDGLPVEGYYYIKKLEDAGG